MPPRTSLSSVALALTLAAPLAAQRATPTAPPRDLDRYVATVMQAFEVPGIALAIVQDGKVVLARGYGVRKLGDPTPVDAYTRFGIASNTKAFTATALGLLVEAGKVDWDAPVIDYLPGFRLWDPYVTREITVRDLLVHRSGLGLGAGDLLWWPPSTYDRQEIMRRLRYIKPATSFRYAYAYDNVLYSVAGELIGAVSGQTWEDFVVSRILKPLGMDSSDVLHSRAGLSGNAATPHARIDGVVRPVAPFTNDNTNPAGGINSGAADIAKWLIVQLDSGRAANGAKLFSPAATRQLWTLVTPIPFGNPPPELAPLRRNFNGYALGFNVTDYRGRRIVTHTGGLPGYVSRLMMVSDLRLGVAVLTNQESGAAFEAITYHVLDHYLNAPPFDWVAGYKAVLARGEARTAAELGEAAARRDTASRPSLPLAAYAATYADAWYGDVGIALENGRLVMRFSHTPSLVGDLEHWQYDTFIVRWRDRELRADAYVTFALEPDGSIAEARMAAVSPETDFSFDFQDLLLRPVRDGAR
jgi:CubicO group peptidase (beta-lactamase class C family)